MRIAIVWLKVANPNPTTWKPVHSESIPRPIFRVLRDQRTMSKINQEGTALTSHCAFSRLFDDKRRADEILKES